MLNTTTDNPINQQIRYSDVGTPELHKHYEKSGGLEQKLNPHTGHMVARVRVQRPIDYYLNRGLIEGYQHLAAGKLDEDFFVMQSHKVRSSLNLSRGGNDTWEFKIDAEQRYNDCMAKLELHERKMIHRIVLDDVYLKDYKKEAEAYGMLAMATTDLLRDVLDKIALFYGVLYRNY